VSNSKSGGHVERVSKIEKAGGQKEEEKVIDGDTKVT